MGLLTRTRETVSSNANAALDELENPDKMLGLALQEMDDELVRLGEQAESAVARKVEVARQRSEAARWAMEWRAKAKIATAKGREDLARTALVEAHVAEESVKVLDAESVELEATIQRILTDRERLALKAEEAKARRGMLVRRHGHARTRRRARNLLRKVETSEILRGIEN